MPRPFTREGIETRLAIRMAYEADPAIMHSDLRRQFNVIQPMVDSALGKTAAEWKSLLDTTPTNVMPRVNLAHSLPTNSKSPVMPGLEQGIVKFTRKPAKMGEDYIFWIPRVYIKNGLVDPSIEYEIYLKRKK